MELLIALIWLVFVMVSVARRAQQPSGSEDHADTDALPPDLRDLLENAGIMDARSRNRHRAPRSPREAAGSRSMT